MTQYRVFLDGKREIQDHVTETLKQLVSSLGYDANSIDTMLLRLDKFVADRKSEPVSLMLEISKNAYLFTIASINGSTASVVYFI